jgi:hypothetical protein
MFLVTFVVAADGVAYRSSDATNGHFWVRLDAFQKELIVFGFIQGVRAHDYELSTFWNITTGRIAERFNDPPRSFMEYVAMLDEYYRDPAKRSVPLWQVLYTQADQGWIDEYQDH